MRRPTGGDPSDEEDDTLMMGWAPGGELPRFDISATGMRRVTPPDEAPEIEVVELDDEPTLIHERAGSQPPPESEDEDGLTAVREPSPGLIGGSQATPELDDVRETAVGFLGAREAAQGYIVRPAPPVPPPPTRNTPLPPRIPPPPRRTSEAPDARSQAARSVESDSSQFAVGAHAFALAQHQASQAQKDGRPPPHVRPIFESRELGSPSPLAVTPQPMPSSQRAPDRIVAALPPPPRDLVSFEPVPYMPPPIVADPSLARAPSRPAPPPSPLPPPPQARVEVMQQVVEPAPMPVLYEDEPGSSRSFYARTQRLRTNDDDDDRPEIQPPRIVPSVIVQPRRRRRSSSLFAGRTGTILGAASLVLSVALGVWLLRPHKGELRIAVFGPRGAVDRAEIFVDGEKKCDTAPCVVADLSPGPRQVQVIAPGYAVTSLTEVVEAGKQRLALASVGTTPGSAPSEGAAPAAAAASPVSTATGELVAGGSNHFRALVDGVDRGALPVRLRDLPAGTHRVRFEGGSRYEPVERMVEVAGARSLDLGSIQLRLLKGSAKIEVAESGARVTIEQNGAEHLLRGPWPMTVDIDATKPARLLARKRGFKDFELALTFPEGQAERTFSVELESSTPTPAAQAAWAGRGRSAPVRERSAPPVEDKSEKSEDAPAPANAGSGTLNINSLPASRVLVDGTPIGSTPKIDYSVSAGTHTITFVHPDLGKKSISVTVKAGQSSVAAVRFKAPSDE
jgi:hypothetical protein